MGRTSFARASRLLERGDIREYILKCVSSKEANHGNEEYERIMREYERIAFSDTSSGEIKVADKLRALDQYRSMCERKEDTGATVLVNYDYGE